MENAAHTLCLLRHNNQCSGRYPSEHEIDNGVPRHFRVSEVTRKTGKHVDKYYYSPNCNKYRSVAEIKRTYIRLKIWLGGSFEGVYPFLEETYAVDVARAFGRDVCFMYNGAYYGLRRLGDILTNDCTVMLVKSDSSLRVQ
jgi:hypothetical protein